MVVAATVFADEIPLTERRSGYEFMSRETRAMQDDDTANPGLLWVLEGGSLWTRKIGAVGRACADCHGDARTSMRGVAARYPAFDADSGTSRQSRAAHQRLPHRAPASAGARVGEPGAAGVDRVRRAPVTRSADRDHGRRAPGRSSRRAAPPGIGARGSSISPAASVTTTTGAASSRAMSSRRRTRPAIRSTGWSGKASARWSGASATASRASVRSRMTTARPSWSTSSST